MERLPAPVKEKILTFPEYKMGAHLVDLVLSDGRVITEVVVAWGDEIVRAGRSDTIEIDVSTVIDAINRA